MPSVGAKIGAFELKALLDRGERGATWLARHRMLDTRHALEVLNPRPSEPVVVAVIEAARLQATVHDAGVVRVTDCGMFEERPFVTRDWVDGRTLADWLDRYGPVQPAAAIELVRGIASGLAAIHEARIVHRDLTPSRIRLDKRRMPKIDGFARARRAHNGSSPTVPPADALRQPSPEYAAPEEFGGGAPADVRADLWTLGVLMYEILTDDLPFLGENTTETIERARRGVFVPMRKRRPDADIPAFLDRVVDRLLSVDPGERPASVADVLASLSQLAG